MTIIVNGFLNGLLITGGYASSGVVPLLCHVDPRAARLIASAVDSDPFGVDPRAAQLVASASDADPFGVDSRAAQLVT